MALAMKEEVLGQFLGDEEFPVTWNSEIEKELFWVYDDLHCPHPLSPMFFDIGGWWLSCDHMFRRFGTPFASDWIAKKVNGYLYTAAVPADPDAAIDAMEYGARYGARVPLDPEYSSKIGTYLGAVLPTYGLEFANWWRDRLVPEMDRNFAYLEGMLDKEDELNLTASQRNQRPNAKRRPARPPTRDYWAPTSGRWSRPGSRSRSSRRKSKAKRRHLPNASAAASATTARSPSSTPPPRSATSSTRPRRSCGLTGM